MSVMIKIYQGLFQDLLKGGGVEEGGANAQFQIKGGGASTNHVITSE